jgi:hypothetical protein
MNNNPNDNPLQKAVVEVIRKALPDVPIFTSSGEPENERDTHFAEFAKLLWEELVRANEQDDMSGFIDVNAGDIDDEEQQRYRAIIARRAFDLAVHVLYTANPIDLDRANSVEDIVDHLPDMASFPEQP